MEQPLALRNWFWNKMLTLKKDRAPGYTQMSWETWEEPKLGRNLSKDERKGFGPLKAPRAFVNSVFHFYMHSSANAFPPRKAAFAYQPL